MANFEPIKNLFKASIFGGRQESDNPQALDEQINRTIFNVLTLLGSILMLPVGVYRIFQGRFPLGITELIIVFVLVLLYILSLFRISFFALSFIMILMVMVMFGLSLNTELFMVGMTLSFLFPMIGISLFGLTMGIALSFAVGMYIIFARWEYFFSSASQGFQIAGSLTYIIIFILTILQNLTKNYKDNLIASINSKLRSERDQMIAMKDNLKTGIFLMDKNCFIQPQYSKALDDILGVTDLEGRDFVVLLASSLNPKESEAIKSFFNMLLNHTHDVSLLEEANPLSQFQYVNTASLETKILRCSFTPINAENDQTFILTTIEDISQETELKQQLSEEEDKRNTEMNTIFEILHIEPQVLMDFIEDSDFEFMHINNTLKGDNESAPSQILKEIYRSVHAIKANALVLGFSNYSDRIHACEEEIRKITDSDTEPVLDDFLHITFHLEALMKVNDELKGIVDRIASFSISAPRKEEIKVLLELLEQTVLRTAIAKGKIVNFSANQSGEMTITGSARRMIKEILMQLIRNAVTHGIETPERRIKAGKDEAGRIDLSIVTNDESIEIELEEDGMGIDYDAVAKHAEKLNLITDEEKTDKLKLLNLLFSDNFSTYKQVDLYAGRGVGLSLVKRLVHELRGTLKIKTKEGVGVKWMISIPLN